MRRFAFTVALTVSLLSLGCSHFHPSVLGPRLAVDEAHCRALDRLVVGFHIGSMIASSGASGSATGAGLFKGNAQYALAGTAGVLGLLGGVFGYLSNFYSARFAKECP